MRDMKAREFHKLASALIGQSNSAEIRTAISRAYYAIFDLAAQFLTHSGLKLSRTNVHVAVQHRLQNCGDPEIQRVGSQLTDLASKRVRADYDLSDELIEDQKTASVVIAQVDRMMQAMEKCLLDQPRKQAIITAIMQWEVITGSRPASPFTHP